jgi:hypothetical protein
MQRTRFCFRVETPAARPDIMSASWLDLSEVRDTDLSFLRANQSLRVLYLGNANSLRGIGTLSQVRELRLLHIPKVHSLKPLAALQDLQVLVIATPPSWDASRRCIEVESLAPLGRLTNLVRLDLCGVLPLDRTLAPIQELVGLRYLLISHVFAFRIEDYAGLARHLTGTVGACLRPCYSMGFETPCRRCGKQTVFLTGPRPRTRRQLCLDCDRVRLKRHIDQWNELAGRVFPYPAKAEDVVIERQFSLSSGPADRLIKGRLRHQARTAQRNGTGE